jgi:hypothetical protein
MGMDDALIQDHQHVTCEEVENFLLALDTIISKMMDDFIINKNIHQTLINNKDCFYVIVNVCEYTCI